MKAIWPFLVLMGIGFVMGEPRGLHLWHDKIPAGFWATFSRQMWVVILCPLFVACFVWVHTVIQKGIAAADPLERANEFLGLVGSMTPEQQANLQSLVRGTHLDPKAPNRMHVGNDDRLVSLHRKATDFFPTDGKSKIWIAEPYRPFALKWASDRSAS